MTSGCSHFSDNNLILKIPIHRIVFSHFSSSLLVVPLHTSIFCVTISALLASYSLKFNHQTFQGGNHALR